MATPNVRNEYTGVLTAVGFELGWITCSKQKQQVALQAVYFAEQMLNARGETLTVNSSCQEMPLHLILENCKSLWCKAVTCSDLIWFCFMIQTE